MGDSLIMRSPHAQMMMKWRRTLMVLMVRHVLLLVIPLVVAQQMYRREQLLNQFVLSMDQMVDSGVRSSAPPSLLMVVLQDRNALWSSFPSACACTRTT